ncbi:hypothetical protein Q5762_08535 [Streptomyces sp. P9(2023)]|uniref:hypothetical protein n=1 Tax=Streptomyces sp. P9(2023) TaxID=3064394 RepID=UPI0028F45E0B|nr:hypothetical protein [Streptomyces sp. P9(2023)]MDT9688402.1 hypothetical protein [Streptomyces sp. P9(2023)]
MRLTKTLAAGAVALSALVTLTGCGGSDEPAEGSGLPKAATMAEVQKFINGSGAQCNELRPYSETAEMAKEARDPAWSIKERAVCQDASGEYIIVLLVDDMTKFQESTAKAQAKGDGKSFLIGQNFAVDPTADDTSRTVVQGGLQVMSCDPKDREDIPSGFTVSEGLAKGCFTTNYIPA